MNLTAKQEAFCQAIADGRNASDAYRIAYPTSETWKPESVWQKSSTLLRNDKVRSRVEYLKAQVAEKILWTREDSVNALKSVIQDGGAITVSAVKELNAMHGFNAPQKIEHTGPDGQPIALVTKIELFS